MRMLLLGMCLTVLSGCMAYRISGYGGDNYTSASPSRKFCIKHLRLTGTAKLPDIIPHVGEISAQDLLDAVNARRPDLFTHSEKDEPIDVEICLGNTEIKDEWSLLVYVCSIGCLPCWPDWVSKHDVIVTFPSRDQGARSAAEKMRISYKFRLTCYTPLGCIPYEDDPKAIVNVRKSPAFPGPGRDQSLLAISESVAKVLSSILQKDKGRPSLTPDRPDSHETVVLPSAKVKNQAGQIRRKDAVSDFFDTPRKRTICPECGAKLETMEKCPLCGK